MELFEVNDGLEANSAIKERIESLRAALKSELTVCARQVSLLIEAAGKRNQAEKKYSRKPSAENGARYDEASEIYGNAYLEAQKSLSLVKKYISAIERDFEKLIFQTGIIDAKSSPKTESESRKFSLFASDALEKINSKLAAKNIFLEALDEELLAAPSSYSDGNKTENIYSEEPRAEAAGQYGGVNLSPINIDISEYVETAVAQAMNKLSSVLERRIDGQIAQGKAALTPTVSEASADILALQNKIADDERFLLDKLSAILDTLKSLNTEIAAIGSEYTAISNKLAEIAELQRQTNDMQRHTLREQQGVQVNQRLINREQISVSEEQASVMNAQKSLTEEQKQLATRQSATADEQRAVVETQSSIDEAMKSVFREQKRLIASQQSIVNESAKQAEIHKQVAEQQAQTAASQKSVQKEQRAVSERQREIADAQRAILDEAKALAKSVKAVSQNKT